MGPKSPTSEGALGHDSTRHTSQASESAICMGIWNSKGDPFRIPKSPTFRDLSNASESEVSQWFDNSGITLGDMYTSPEKIDLAKQTCYTYKDLFINSLADLHPSNLIKHAIHLAPGSRAKITHPFPYIPAHIACAKSFFQPWRLKSCPRQSYNCFYC